MNERLLTALLGLYPREWRERYGGEVRELVQLLSERDGRSLMGMLPGLVVGATLERLYVLRRFDRAGLAAAAVATVAVLGGSLAGPHRHGATRGVINAPLPRRRTGAVAALRSPAQDAVFVGASPLLANAGPGPSTP